MLNHRVRWPVGLSAARLSVMLSASLWAAPGGPKWQSAELVLDVFGSNGGHYANKPVMLNGVSLGNLLETAADSWAKELAMPLGPAALRALATVNVVHVHNEPGDCMKLRRLQIRAVRADGKTESTNLDGNVYSTPARWSYAEGIAFPPKAPMGPIVLSFDPAIPRFLQFEQEWYCARTLNGGRAAIYRPGDGSATQVELPLPMAGEAWATPGPIVTAQGRTFAQLVFEGPSDVPAEAHVLVKLRNPLKTPPRAMFVGKPPEKSERVPLFTCDDLLVAAVPMKSWAATGFLPLPTNRDTTPPRIADLKHATRALKHTRLTVTVSIDEDIGLRHVQAVGKGSASPTTFRRAAAGCYQAGLPLTDAGAAHFTIVAEDLFGNVSRSEERTVTTFLPRRLRGAQYSPTPETLCADLDHFAAFGANVIATGAHRGQSVRDLIAEAHKRGLLVVWNMYPNWARYLQTWLQSHTDSLIRASNGRLAFIDGNRDGTPDKAYGCFSSEPFRKHFAAYAATVISECDFDGIQIEEPYYYYNDLCYCEHCRAGFASFLANKYAAGAVKATFGVGKASQVHVPSDKERNQHRREWFEWTEYHVAAEMGWLERTFAAARAASQRTWGKDVRYTGYCQGTDRWYMWPGLFTRRLAAPFVTHINSGAWYRKGEARVEETRLCLFNAEVAGGAARYHGKASMLWVQAWPCKYGLPFTPRDMIVDMMEVFAHGVGMIPLGRLGPKGEPSLVDAARQAYGLMKEVEEPMGGVTKVATAALFRSYDTLRYDWLRTQNEYNHHQLYLAFLLARAHVPFDVIDELLPDRLSRYRVLILDNVSILRPDEIVRIEEWVRAGGRLVLIGPCGVQDQYGQPAASEMWLGVTGSAVWAAPMERTQLSADDDASIENVPTAVAYGRTLLEIPQPKYPQKNPPRERVANVGHAVEGAGQAAMRWQDGGTAISVRPYGRGKVMVSGAYPEYASLRDGQLLVEAITRWADAQGDEPVSADPDIEVVAYASDESYWLMLMNHGPEGKREVRMSLARVRAKPGSAQTFQIREDVDASCGYRFVVEEAARVSRDGRTVVLPRLGLFAALHLELLVSK